MAGAFIEWQGLSFCYPSSLDCVLRDVNLTIAEGEFVLVAGRSGAGKSTLLRTLNGLVPHFSGGRISGHARVAGHDAVQEGPHAMSSTVGFVHQDPEAQSVVDTVEDELAFAMENQGWPQALMRQRVQAVLEQLGITGLRHRSIHGLSAGQKQRVAIGSALTLQPRVLVLDEPTSQLDPQAADDVLSTLQQLSHDQGLTIVLSEHRLERVAPYADRVIYLAGAGQPPVSGAPRRVLAEMPFAPPVVQLAQALGWRPIPLTVKEARQFADQANLNPPNACSTRETGRARTVSIEAQGVWYDYDGAEALRGAEFQVGQGELVALTGRNGSGKTTLLKHFVGLLKPRQGKVIAHGMDTQLAKVEDLVEHVGYVPQNPSSLLFADTVRQELAFTRHAHHLPPANHDGWLELLGLAGLGERYPRDLSVGERQRVALAAILVAEPVTLLLDEPTRGLDPLEKASLAGFLEAQASRGHAVIVATHDVELTAQCAQRIIVLHAGRVVADGPVGEVMSQRPIYSSQVNQLFHDPRILTVRDALHAQAH